MRVVHVPFGYYPDAVGGTEAYVAELARGLRACGVDSVVAAPAGSLGVDRYEHDGTPVHRFAMSPTDDVAELYGEGDRDAATTVARILDEVRADVLHLHAFTRAASLHLARAARRQGVPVVFTYHTPTASCVRGTLLRDGRETCDGALIGQRCTACLLESRGVPLAARTALSRAPAAFGSAIAAAGATGRWATALRARELIDARHDAFRQLLSEANAIVAVCEWVRALLLRAGAHPARLILSRQGTPAHPPPLPRRPWSAGEALRTAFVGRLHSSKGVHVVIAALVGTRALPITLDVYGIVQDAEAERYRDQLRAMAAADPRIRFCTPLPRERVVDTLADYDLTVVPSQWLETGPLVVLESFAAGVPVVGSNLGGIAELVRHDRDGWLVRNDPRAWSSALVRFASDRAHVERLRVGVERPRSTDDVARDMVAVYESVAPAAARRGFRDTAGIA